MNSAGEAFGWAFRDPSWAGKMIVQALILIIPIVGWIATTGWLMMAFENARAGRNELPPAGFHLSRGIAFFGVLLIYSIALNIPGWILQLVGSAGMVQRCNQGFCSSQFVGGPLSGLGALWGFLVQLLIYFITPTLVVMVFHHGFAGGFDLAGVWRYATTNVGNSIIAAMLFFVSSIIGALGVIACCIGVFLTIVYSVSVQAGVAAWFERVQSAPATPTAPAA